MFQPQYFINTITINLYSRFYNNLHCEVYNRATKKLILCTDIKNDQNQPLTLNCLMNSILITVKQTDLATQVLNNMRLGVQDLFMKDRDGIEGGLESADKNYAQVKKTFKEYSLLFQIYFRDYKIQSFPIIQIGTQGRILKNRSRDSVCLSIRSIENGSYYKSTRQKLKENKQKQKKHYYQNNKNLKNIVRFNLAKITQKALACLSQLSFQKGPQQGGPKTNQIKTKRRIKTQKGLQSVFVKKPVKLAHVKSGKPTRIKRTGQQNKPFFANKPKLNTVTFSQSECTNKEISQNKIKNNLNWKKGKILTKKGSLSIFNCEQDRNSFPSNKLKTAQKLKKCHFKRILASNLPTDKKSEDDRLNRSIFAEAESIIKEQNIYSESEFKQNQTPIPTTVMNSASKTNKKFRLQSSPSAKRISTKKHRRLTVLNHYQDDPKMTSLFLPRQQFVEEFVSQKTTSSDQNDLKKMGPNLNSHYNNQFNFHKGFKNTSKRLQSQGNQKQGQKGYCLKRIGMKSLVHLEKYDSFGRRNLNMYLSSSKKIIQKMNKQVAMHGCPNNSLQEPQNKQTKQIIKH